MTMPPSVKKTNAQAAVPESDTPQSFELALAELELIVAQMDSGQMPLEASLAAYKRGNLLLQFCQTALANIEQQVQLLNDKNQLISFDLE